MLPKGSVVPALARIQRLSGPSLVLIEATATSTPVPEEVLRELQRLPHLFVAISDRSEADGSLASACDLIFRSNDLADGLQARLDGLERQARRPAVIILAQLLRSRASEEARLQLESLSYATLQGGHEFEAWLRSRQS